LKNCKENRVKKRNWMKGKIRKYKGQPNSSNARHRAPELGRQGDHEERVQGCFPDRAWKGMAQKMDE
jgi:hypothetical protein